MTKLPEPMPGPGYRAPNAGIRGLDFWNARLDPEVRAELEEIIDGDTYLVVVKNGVRSIIRVAQ